MASKILSLQPNKPSSVLSFSLSDLLPSFDVVDQLTNNRSTYIGGTDPDTGVTIPMAQVSIYDLPQYLITCIDRVRARVSGHNKPGVSPIIACCIDSAVNTLTVEDSDIHKLLGAKQRFDLLESDQIRDSWVYEECATILRSFPISAPDSTLSGKRRQNIYIPSTIKQRVSDMARDLGMSISSVIILCIMIALADQPFMQIDRREDIKKSVALFVVRLKVRYKVITALFEVLGVTPQTATRKK